MIICSNCAHECSDSMNFCPNYEKTLEKEQNISTQDTMVQARQGTVLCLEAAIVHICGSASRITCQSLPLGEGGKNL